MNKITFLTKNQLIGEKKLDIIKKIGAQATISDYAILSGGIFLPYYRENNELLGQRMGCYWTKSECPNQWERNAYRVEVDGSVIGRRVSERHYGIRPVLTYTGTINDIPTNGEKPVRGSDGVLRAEYGYYIKTAVSNELGRALEKLLRKNKLGQIKNNYTRASFSNYHTFELQSEVIYEYRGKKYARVSANYSDAHLSNGSYYRKGDNVWLLVEPITWLASEEQPIMLCETILTAGIMFNENDSKKQPFHWNETTIKKYLDQYLSKEIFQTNYEKVDLNNKNESEQTEQIDLDLVTQLAGLFKQRSEKALQKRPYDNPDCKRPYYNSKFKMKIWSSEKEASFANIFLQSDVADEELQLEVYRRYIQKHPKRAITYHILEYIISCDFEKHGVENLTTRQKDYINLYGKQILKRDMPKAHIKRLFELMESFPVLKEYIQKCSFDIQFDEKVESAYRKKYEKMNIPEKISFLSNSDNQLLEESLEQKQTEQLDNSNRSSIAIDEEIVDQDNMDDEQMNDTYILFNKLIQFLQDSYTENGIEAEELKSIFILLLKLGYVNKMDYRDEEIMDYLNVSKAEIYVAIREIMEKCYHQMSDVFTEMLDDSEPEELKSVTKHR